MPFVGILDLVYCSVFVYLESSIVTKQFFSLSKMLGMKYLTISSAAKSSSGSCAVGASISLSINGFKYEFINDEGHEFSSDTCRSSIALSTVSSISLETEVCILMILSTSSEVFELKTFQSHW